MQGNGLRAPSLQGVDTQESPRRNIVVPRPQILQRGAPIDLLARKREVVVLTA